MMTRSSFQFMSFWIKNSSVIFLAANNTVQIATGILVRGLSEFDVKNKPYLFIISWQFESS